MEQHEPEGRSEREPPIADKTPWPGAATKDESGWPGQARLSLVRKARRYGGGQIG